MILCAVSLVCKQKKNFCYKIMYFIFFITGLSILKAVSVMYVIPCHGCMLYHVIVMPGFGAILNCVVIVVVCLSTLHWCRGCWNP